MAEDHGAPEAGQLFRTKPEVVERQKVAKKRAARRIHSWIVQNERGVLGRMAAEAAGRILDFADSRDKSLTEGCVL